MELKRRQFGSNKLPVCLLVATFGVFLLLYGRIVIESDGITYYALTISLLHDHDFDLRNQYEKMPEIRVVQNSVTGKPASMYSCGIAILYAPFLWITESLGSIFPNLGQWRPYAQNVRFPLPDALGILIASSFFGLLSVLLAALLLVRNYNAPFGIAVFLALSVFLGTSLGFYTFCSPSFLHAPDGFLVAAAFYFAMMNRHGSRKLSARNMLVGFFLALSLMLRNNNIVLIPPIVGGILFFERKEGWKWAAMTCIEVLVGALPVLAVHLWYNWTQYGRLFATGYRVDLSDEGISHKWFALKRIHVILINPGAGMFVGAPVTFLGIIGLIVGSIRKRKEPIIALVCVVIAVVSIRFAGFAWTGASFGQRYVIHLFVFFVIGLYELVLLWKKPALIVTAMCLLWSFTLWNAYLINFASPRLRSTLTIQYGREITPFLLLKNTREEYLSAKESGTATNFVQFWWNSLGARPYPTLIHIMSNEEPSEKEKPVKEQRLRKTKT